MMGHLAIADPGAMFRPNKDGNTDTPFLAGWAAEQGAG